MKLININGSGKDEDRNMLQPICGRSFDAVQWDMEDMAILIREINKCGSETYRTTLLQRLENLQTHMTE
jgi:hypothetical protein